MTQEEKEIEKVKLSVTEKASFDLKEVEVEADNNSVTESDLEGLEESSKKEQAKQPESMPVINDRYKVLEFIGSGGMGSVYKVFDKELGKDQAVKILRDELAQDSTAVKRFRSQVDVVSDLEHDGLVNVYGHGETVNGKPYVVMDFVKGKTLQNILEQEGKLETKRAIQIFVKIAEALVYAHGKGLIHRDIKPSNIMITESVNGEDQVCIVDFGIAQVAQGPDDSSTITQTGEVLGSALYMSPEQCRGKKVDERSDIYSLGCLMYEVLVGEQPFKGANPVLTILNHIENPINDVPVKTGDTKLDGWLQVAILRCIELKPERRFKKVEFLLEDLKKILKDKSPEGEPIENSIGRWIQQNEKRIEVPAGIILAGLSLIGLYSAGNLLPFDQTQVFIVFIFGLNTLMLSYGLYRYVKQRVKPPKAEYYSGLSTLLFFLLSIVFLLFTIGVTANGMYNYSIFGVVKISDLFAWNFLLSVISAFFYVVQWGLRKLKPHKFALVGINFAFILILFFNQSVIGQVINLSNMVWLQGIHSQNVKLKRATDPWNFRTAISLSNFSLLLNPGDLSIYRTKAKLYIYLQEYDKALDIVNKAIAIEPKASNFYTIRLEIHKKQSKTKEALKDYNKILQYSNASKDGLYCGRAELLFKDGQFENALQDYDKAISINPSYSMGYIGRGNCLAKLGQLDKSISSFSTAIELDKDNYRALYHRGLAYLKSNKIHLGYKDLNDILGRYLFKGSDRSKAELAYYQYIASKVVSKDKTKKYLEKLDDLGYKLGNDEQLLEKYPFEIFY